MLDQPANALAKDITLDYFQSMMLTALGAISLLYDEDFNTDRKKNFRSKVSYMSLKWQMASLSGSSAVSAAMLD